MKSFIKPSQFQFQATRQFKLAEMIEAKVVALQRDALRVINCCLAGSATHKLYDLLELVFGPDVHLGPTYTGDSRQAADDEEGLTEYEEGEDNVPVEDPSSHPSPTSKDSKQLQEAIEQSLETAAEAGKDILLPLLQWLTLL